MATLNSISNTYSSANIFMVNLIQNNTEIVQSMEEVTSGTEKASASLKRTDAMVNRASSSIGKLAGKIGNLGNLTKTMNLADSYMNMNAKLSLVTDGLEEQKALQQDIFAAAHRAGGNYGEMAAASARMMEGGVFGNGKEAVGFTELLAKSVKLSGGGQAQQRAVLSQMTEAMTSGGLESSDFSSILQDVPAVADAIADYMGVSTGELERFASQGILTSDIVKNAMFYAADEINGRFNQLPMTFGDACSRIKNVGMSAFGGVFEKLNQGLNSISGHQAMHVLLSGIYTAANFIGVLVDSVVWFGNAIAENWGMALPMVTALIGAFMAYNVALGITNVALAVQTVKEGIRNVVLAMSAKGAFLAKREQYGFNAALLACPLTWVAAGLMLIVGGLYLGVAAFNKFTGSSVSATGLIVGAVFAAGALIGNLFIGIYNLLMGILMDGTNLFISFCEFLVNVFHNPVFAVKNLFADLALFVLGVMESLASVIDTVFGSDLSGAVGVWADKVNGFKQDIANEKTETFERADKSSVLLDRIGYDDAFQKGYNIGSDAADSVASLFDRDIFGSEPFEFDPSPYASGGDDPMTVKGAGQGGAVKVENEDDIEWMRRLAERDYVARISQNTLAPNIRVEFTGPITKEADVDGVAAHMAEQLKEVIASSPEGVYV